MADFYPVLARAIAALPNNTPIARAAIYDRARSALTAKLRAVAPPMAEADIQREVESLLRAAARVEAEQMAVLEEEFGNGNFALAFRHAFRGFDRGLSAFGHESSPVSGQRIVRP